MQRLYLTQIKKEIPLANYVNAAPVIYVLYLVVLLLHLQKSQHVLRCGIVFRKGYTETMGKYYPKTKELKPLISGRHISEKKSIQRRKPKMPLTVLHLKPILAQWKGCQPILFLKWKCFLTFIKMKMFRNSKRYLKG